jgi:manganese oxidase
MTAQSRRAFLKLGAAMPIAGVALGADVAEERLRIAPQLSQNVPICRSGTESAPATTYDQAAVDRSLNTKVTALHGLDPLEFLRNFDWGRTSELADGRTLRQWSIVAEPRQIEVAPGIFFPAWTYNGAVPGPTLRCREGDRVRIRFFNRLASEHTMHFHGAHPANMDGVDEVVSTGQSYVYEFDAAPAGFHLYHCHVPPTALHMARGLYGAFIIDPLAMRSGPATELVLVASGWDLNFDEQNEIYAVNGGANFYRDNPINIKAQELVRLYFLNVLEHDPINSLHLHATSFKSYRGTGSDELGERTDVVALCQADRRVIEFSYKYPGRYMFHAHQNKFAERGWMANFEVS